MDDFEQAVTCSLQPTCDPTLKAQANAYCDSFKSQPNAWSLALARFVRRPTASIPANADLVRFFCLHVLEETISKHYDSLAQTDRITLREGLVGWMQHNAVDNDVAPYIWNKFAQLLALIFRHEFLQGWGSFFNDLVALLSQGPHMAHVFLRVCGAVHSEVVSRDISRTQAEMRENMAVKDAMRRQCVQVLAGAWLQVLTAYGDNPEITNTCLTVIGQFVSWIDIGLVVNDTLLPLILLNLKRTDTREAACQCVADIINKGMPGSEKVCLLQTLGLLPMIQSLATQEEDDEDFLDWLAKLLDIAGTTIIECIQEAQSAAVPAAPPPGCNELLLEAVNLMFAFLNHEIDDVSNAVATFAQAYIGLVKFQALKMGAGLTQTQQGHMQTLLNIITRKLKFDDSYNFEKQGEDEAFFDIYRKSLLTMLNNMAYIDNSAIVTHTEAYLDTTINTLSQIGFADVEVALLLLHHMGEVITAGELYKRDPPSPLYGMMARVMASPIPTYPHRAVNLMFFECIARYWRCFQSQPEMIPATLDAFFSNVGLNHPSGQVRSQACYGFSKFCHQLLKQLHSYVELILTRIQPLLVLRVGKTGARGPSGTHLAYDDQLFLFETASCLMFSEAVPEAQQRPLLENCLGPPMTECQSIMNEQRYLTDTENMPTYTTFLVQVLGVVTRMAKSADKRCPEYFLECFRVFVPTLRITVNQTALRNAVITFCHRMVTTGDQSVLSEIPSIVIQLLQSRDVQVVSEAVVLLTQLISKYKGVMAAMLNELLLGIVTAIFETINAPYHSDDREHVRLLKDLKQAYFKLLFTMATNELDDVFLSERNAPHLPNILQTVVEGGSDASDPTSQKSAFGVLRVVAQAWLAPEKTMGFTQYCYDNVVPACFVAVFKPDFDPTDAQAGVNVLNEVAMLQKTLYTKLGDGYLDCLGRATFPSLQINHEMGMEFATSIRDLSDGPFKKFFRQFVNKRRALLSSQ